MSKVLLKLVILFALLVTGSFTVYLIPLVTGISDSVTVTSTNAGDRTILQVNNNADSTSNVSSFLLEVKDGNFKSFNLQNGWIGKKTSPTTVAFVSSNPIKPGESVTFEIKTDQQAPFLIWKALDANNNQLGSGQIGNQQKQTGNQTRTQGNIGILDSSTFRIIPSTPSPGYHIRVVGQSFASSTNLDLYIGNNKIDSFTSKENGNFVVTTMIPDTQQPGSVTLVLKDQQENQRTFTTNIKPQPPSPGVAKSVPLTVNVDPITHRGETQLISGTANPGSTVSISILDSSNKAITDFPAKAGDDGKYSVSNTTPIDRAFGKYTVSVSDGNGQISKQYSVVSTHQIYVITSQPRYEPGQLVIINGTAISNQIVTFTIKDSTGNSVYTKDINVTADGKISLNYQLDDSAIKGTYEIIVSQGSDQVPAYFGVGEDPTPRLTVVLNKLNYINTDKPVINISGPPSSTLNLVIVDPSAKQKFADTILLGGDGLTAYSFNLTSYTPGVYSAVITRGNYEVMTQFAVGLPTGCGQIVIKTAKDVYVPSDSIIIIGTANPNTIIYLSLTDPNGITAKIAQTFTDNTGHFSSSNFRIPANGHSGTWTIGANCGINHKSLPISVKSSNQLITIHVDKDIATYSRGNIITISGTDAGVSADISIKILGINSTQIAKLQIGSTNRGEYSTVWTIPLTLSTGNYTIQAASITGKASLNITVQ